ncbi:hypothetical protein [Pseudanabaena sp. 'Roaring Creek']|uniref:hypothetical protein n=1 Tax=Pseudanabaena sp. 'Roaring Creek' TaxID=1681830 RepID=UPI0006D857C3|nr:hypothetical protein [Pseudanabaena sp. 'Roaring Creek']
MTAFNASTDLPTGTGRTIDTVEKLLLWAAEILLVNNPTDKYVRVAGAASENTVQITSGTDADNTVRIQCSVTFKYDLTQLGGSSADWYRASTLNTAPIPAVFKG